MTPDLTQVVDAWQWRIYLNILLNLIGAAGVIVSIFVSVTNRHHLTNLSIQIDGRLEELMKTSNLAAAAQGNLDGRAEQLVEREREGHAPLLVGTGHVEGTIVTQASGEIAVELRPVVEGDAP